VASSEREDDLVFVGRVGKPHGLRGDVAINPDTDFAEERFAPGAELLMRSAAAGESGPTQRVTVDLVRFHNGRPIVRFMGVSSIEQAEPLVGATLWVRADSRPPLPEGQFYHDALIGCDVETVAGETIGRVTRIDNFGSAPLLVVTDSRHVASRDAAELLVPLADAICVRIDPAARRIVIDPPEGLLDVNLTRGS
jgi:16S rRNA processing protein RimM